MSVELFEKYYNELNKHKEIDEDAKSLWNSLIEAAIEYTNIRAKWSLMANEERSNNDSLRTKLHNSFINRLNIYMRYVGEQGINLLSNELASQDRKKVGDFANFVVFKVAVENR
ncbi:MAG: hypothetical protein IKI71_04640 [Lachnospiraceae bacterium]|nr:hypothetical protein [Lachnospiraceae bacterium]